MVYCPGPNNTKKKNCDKDFLSPSSLPAAVSPEGWSSPASGCAISLSRRNNVAAAVLTMISAADFSVC